MKKKVTWEAVRNLANRLTNQLYMGAGVDIAQAHVSSGFQAGALRDFTLEPGREGYWRDAGGWGGWHAFDEADVSRLYWESLTSGSGLEAIKEAPGEWTLKFIPSSKDPEYRGYYADLWETAETLENIDPDYVYQNA